MAGWPPTKLIFFLIAGLGLTGYVARRQDDVASPPYVL
jgi:hypothetical protein